MLKRTTTLTVAAALALTLGACSRDTQSQDAPAPGPSISLPATPEPSSGLVTPEAAPSDEAPVDPNRSGTSLVPAAADAEATQGAAEAALRTAQAWIQGTTLDQEPWNQALLETLAPIARPAYDDKLWGYQVDDSVILGEPVVAEATMLTAEVAIPTDAGEVNLVVAREDETSPWMTTAIE